MITAEKRQRQEFIKIINKLKNRYNFCVGYFSLKHKPSQKAVPFFQLQRKKGREICYLRSPSVEQLTFGTNRRDCVDQQRE